MNDLCGELRKAGLMINYAKTEEIRVNNIVDRPITIENREINQVTNFCYLRSNRGRGRPRNSWRRSTLREAARSWSELRYLAADREK
jgi:sarcosine oxidase delta subunit